MSFVFQDGNDVKMTYANYMPHILYRGLPSTTAFGVSPAF